MALVNVAYNVSFGWDQPRLRSLEAQMLVPLMNEHPVELGLGVARPPCARSSRSSRDYARGFAQAFPGERHARDPGEPHPRDRGFRAHADLRALAL